MFTKSHRSAGPLILTVLLGCGSSEGGASAPPGTTPGEDGGTPAEEGGMPGQEGGMPGEDGSAAENDAGEWDGSLPDWEAGSAWPEPEGTMDLEPAPSPDLDPILTLTSHNIFEEPDATIAGSAIDPAQVASATWSLDGSPAEAISLDASGQFSFPVVLTPGWHTLRLTAKTPANETRASVEYVAYDTKELSSFAMIDLMLTAGVIDAETALIYKVFALHRDKRLPDELRGFDAMEVMAPVMLEVQARFDTLSDKAKQTLEPFLMPPFYKRSWWGLDSSQRDACPPTTMLGCAFACMSTDWEYLDGQFVRVWWRKAVIADKVNANRILETVETRENAWLALHNVMKRVPVSDSKMSCNGGDGKLDIVLVPMGEDGVTNALLYGSAVPSYILINANMSIPRQQGAVVHELMHAFQFAFPLGQGDARNYFTLMESTACWAADHVWKRANQWEQMYTAAYTATTDVSWNKPEPPRRAYGAYLFPMALDRGGLGADVIREMWAQSGAQGEIEAVAKAVEAKGSKLADKWKEFAAAVWNNDNDGSGKFSSWDGLKLEHPPLGTLELAGGDDDDLEIPSDVQPLAMRFNGVEIGTGSEIHSVAFLNGLTNKMSLEQVVAPPQQCPLNAQAKMQRKPANADIAKTVGVQVIERRNATWGAPTDLSAKYPSYKAWCRDTQADRIDGLAVVFSYGDHHATAELKPEAEQSSLIISDMLCDDANIDADITRNSETETSNLKVKGKMKKQADLVVPGLNGGLAVVGFELAGDSGTMDHKFFSADGTCTAAADWSGPFGASTTEKLAALPFVRGDQSHSYVYWGIPSASLTTTLTQHCPDGDASWFFEVGKYWTFLPFDDSGNGFKATDSGEYSRTAVECLPGDGDIFGEWSITGNNPGI